MDKVVRAIADLLVKNCGYIIGKDLFLRKAVNNKSYLLLTETSLGSTFIPYNHRIYSLERTINLYFNYENYETGFEKATDVYLFLMTQKEIQDVDVINMSPVQPFVTMVDTDRTIGAVNINLVQIMEDKNVN